MIVIERDDIIYYFTIFSKELSEKVYSRTRTI